MGTYTNPILPGFNPDPSIIRVGKDYFCITSSFEYFPGIPLYHSTDLIKWTLTGHILTRKSQLDIRTPEPGGGIWASTIRYHEGVFYVITSAFDRYRPQTDDRVWPRGFYVKTTDIWDEGSWSDPVYLDMIGFDHDLFWDDDGTVYVSSTYKIVRDRQAGKKDFAIHVARLEMETGRLISVPKLVRRSESGIAEGSHLFKRNGWYYLFTAEGGTEGGHCEYVSRCREGPFGPWELAPSNPLWRNTTEDEVQNTGHCDLVEDTKGQWWAVCLGVRPRKSGQDWRTSVFGRESMLLPVRWENDWPIFNERKPVTLKMEGEGLYGIQDEQGWKDNFQSKKLSLGWYRKNTPITEDFSLTARNGHLTLFGSPYPLSMPACPTLFLRKQRHWPVTWETQLDFLPQTALDEAGTVVYWNHTCFASIGIRARVHGDKLQRIVRFSPPANAEEVVDHEISDNGEVKFLVDCTPTHYRFAFKEAKEELEEWKWLGEVDTQVMTRNPDVGAPFTGMMFGLYSYGEMQPVLTPAHFAYAEFR